MEKDGSVVREPGTGAVAERPVPGDMKDGAEEQAGALVAEDVVDWEGDDDVEKPVNWSTGRKLKNIVVICYTTFLTYDSFYLLLLTHVD
jgi:hypothetical protein